MKVKNVYRLMPNEYKSFTSLDGNPIMKWVIKKGLLITKNGENIPVRTAFSIDNGCEIEVTYYDSGYGKVKYLKSTPRRKYYKFITWYILFLELISAIFITYEINVNNNYATSGSRTEKILFILLASWIALTAVVLRNTKGFNKIVMTILSYVILTISTVNLIAYFIALIND